MRPAERRELARDLSRLANAGAAAALEFARAGGSRCPLIGITGPPGVGKSSLIGKFAASRVAAAGSVAILAIDPSSPLTGGAILGDRVRMAELADDPRVFIRSLAARGSRDGLADNLPLLIDRVVRAGFGEVLLETVGVGQVEYAVRGLVDTLLLVLAPGTGDQIQAMKSGIIELPDIIVINKADLPGADRSAGEVQTVVELRPRTAGGWRPPVVKVSAERGAGLADLAQAVGAHRTWLGRVPSRERDLAWRRQLLQQLAARRLAVALESLPADVLAGPPHEAYRVLLRALDSDE